jgi:hypothetical protein
MALQSRLVAVTPGWAPSFKLRASQAFFEFSQLLVFLLTELLAPVIAYGLSRDRLQILKLTAILNPFRQDGGVL